MIKLLRSDFSRLYRNGMFRILLAASVIVGVICPLYGRRMLEIAGITIQGFCLDYYFFRFANVIAFAVGVFCSFFVGIEYSDGTLRNKITVGHSRKAIYLANFITNAAAGCILYTVYMVVDLCVGLPLMGAFQRFGLREIITLILCAYGVMISLAAMFTMVTMLVSSRVFSFMICMCGLLAALFFGIHQLNMLSDAVFWMGESRRGITVFFLNFLPGSQLMEFFALQADTGERNPYVMLGGSVFFVLVSTVFGIFVFRRKQLK